MAPQGTEIPVFDNQLCDERWTSARIINPFNRLDRDRLIQPPETIVTFTRRLPPRYFDGHDKRAHERRNIVLPLIVQPLDHFVPRHKRQTTDIVLEPSGAPFRSLTFDISTGGLGFVHMRRITSQFAAIEIDVPDYVQLAKIQVLIEIRHSESVRGGLFTMGGMFLKRLDAPTETTSPEDQENAPLEDEAKVA